jgi:hypothetical protein
MKRDRNVGKQPLLWLVWRKNIFWEESLPFYEIVDERLPRPDQKKLSSLFYY